MGDTPFQDRVSKETMELKIYPEYTEGGDYEKDSYVFIQRQILN